MIDLCLLGTGGMMPLPGRHLTSLLLRNEGHSVLLDCGEGTQVAIRKYGWSMHSIDAICFTHIHGDHVAGISGLLSSAGTEGRKEPLHIYGPSHIDEVVSALCVVCNPPFDIYFHQVKSWEEFQLGKLRVTPFALKHNIECYGYRFDLDRLPEFQPDRARALEIPVQYWSKLQKGESIQWEGRQVCPEEVLGPPRKGISLVYATDTRPCRNLERAAEGTDLLITEGIYGDKEKAASAAEKKHMTSQEAAILSKKAGAKEVWLTHYSPSFRNQKAYADAIRAINPVVHFGRDGMKKTLNFPE